MSYHSYIFFDVEPTIKSLSERQLKKDKKKLENFFKNQKTFSINTYSTLGLKADTRFMFHIKAQTLDIIQNFLRDLLHTPLGVHLRITYTLCGMTKPSQYSPKHESEENSLEVPHRYLIVYPFTKTTEWHLLPFEERKNIMKAHVEVGRKFSSIISQLLLYAYGIDDHEFIVSYYTNRLEDFQNLVMEMRTTESRRYTKSDTPIFTCIHMSLMDVLLMI